MTQRDLEDGVRGGADEPDADSTAGGPSAIRDRGGRPINRADIDRALAAGTLRLDEADSEELDAVLRGSADATALTMRLWDEALQIEASERDAGDLERYAERRPTVTAALVATDVLDLLRFSAGPDDCARVATTPWLEPSTADQVSAKVSELLAERRVADTSAPFTPPNGEMSARQRVDELTALGDPED